MSSSQTGRFFLPVETIELDIQTNATVTKPGMHSKYQYSYVTTEKPGAGTNTNKHETRQRKQMHTSPQSSLTCF